MTEELALLSIRKLADTSVGERVKGYDPMTGEPALINPATGMPEAWPLAGIKIEGEAPRLTRVPMRWVQNGRAEGWIRFEGERIEHAPAGPPSAPWSRTHTFIAGDRIVLLTVDGEVVYDIVRNPGKYPDGTELSGSRVDWFYEMRLAG